jgi:hypothetical protein
MLVAEVLCNSQAAHCRRSSQEIPVVFFQSQWNLLALLQSLHAYFRHSALFTIAHGSLANARGMESMPEHIGSKHVPFGTARHAQLKYFAETASLSQAV